MSCVKEYPVWISPVYKIEYEDPLMGGEFGTNNIQARQLACKTRYLKELFGLEHNDDGSHRLSSCNVATDAAIEEYKLSLNYTTKNIADYIELLKNRLNDTNENISAITGETSMTLQNLYDALVMSWRYGHPCFSFDLFADNVTYRDFITPVPLLETIAGDDSIDVSTSVDVKVGHTYLIYDQTRNMRRIVMVKKVLTNERVILWEDESQTRLKTGVLTKTDWTISERKATTTNESIYITGFITSLSDYKRGYLVISHNTDIDFQVAYNRLATEVKPVWNNLPKIEKEYSTVLGSWLTRVELPGGEFALKIVALGETEISNMGVMSDIKGALSTTVRTPLIIDNNFKIQRFGAIYGATHTKTEIKIATNATMTNDATIITLPSMTNDNPIWDIKDQVLALHTFESGNKYYWQARNFASDGYVSNWSEIGVYTASDQVTDQATD